MSDQGSSSVSPTQQSSASSGRGFSRDQFLHFIKHSPNDCAIFDRNMLYLACSDRHLQKYGLSQEQVIGKSHYEFFSNIPQRFYDAHQQALNGAMVKKDQDYCLQRLC